MKKSELLKRPPLPDEVAIALKESSGTLNVAGIYQDEVTRDWGMQFCRRATRVAGEQSVQSAWYDASSLSDPEYLQDAVRTTIEADVIVVSVHAAFELPLDVYLWVGAWLPRRIARTGALTALIGVAEPLNAQIRTVEYLQAVARMAQLDFAQEHKQPVAYPSPSFPASQPPSQSARKHKRAQNSADSASKLLPSGF